MERPFYDYAISGNDVRAYILLRKGLVYATVGDLSGSNDRVVDPTGNVVKLDDGWVAYEVGMLRLLQYSAKQDVKPINTISSDVAVGNAKGRTTLTGRMVFRNTNVGTLTDIKNRILKSDKFSIKISSTGFGVDFEEEFTYDNVNDAQPITDFEEISWAKMPVVDILLVASDERQIEYPRVCRFKDVAIGDTGSSEGATDTEENEFCNFVAASGHTPWRTLERKNYTV